MNVWTYICHYEGELAPSVHMTELGCVITAIADVMEYHGVDSYDDEEFQEWKKDRNMSDNNVDGPGLVRDLDAISRLDRRQLWQVWEAWSESTWDCFDYSVGIDEARIQT